MALASGAHLGPYEILAAIGAGGMGEVYRARDTKLNRDVALKILPEAFALDADRLARFKREAQVLASLDHPNIGAIYGFEDADGVHALVLQSVEGPTLADRITKGPIPLDEALPIAGQIAEALEAAHAQGIIHRDLKPANVKVRSDGTVKVLDFGLAKAMDSRAELARSAGHEGAAFMASQSPTMTSPAMMTAAGVILGTAAYMAPEQARGRAVDTRADIWAFGCVLFEMLAGQRPFAGGDITEVVAAIMRDEPAWKALPPSTPSVLRRLLRRCLQKDLKQRLQSIGDARIDIGDLIGGVSEPATAAPVLPAVPAWRRRLPWAVASALAAVSVAMLLFWAPWRTRPALALARLSAEIGVDASLPAGPTSAVLALSPDGTRLAFTAQKSGTTQLYVRLLGQLTSTAVADSAGARDPFFSPDGQWLAFFAGGKLRKVPMTGGGAAVTICDALSDRGGTWTEDHTIVFQAAANGALVRVGDAGGKPEPLTLSAGEYAQRWPQALPGGKEVLYSSHTRGTFWDDANLVVQPLPSGTPKVIHHGGYYGRYLASGHLVYIHNNTLFAAPFDLRRLELTGSPVPVLEGVSANPTAVTPGAAAFAASDTGMAVYVSTAGVNADAPIQWLDRAGSVTPLRATPADWSGPRFAPDGRQIAMTVRDGAKSDVWVYEWARDTVRRLTIDAGSNAMQAWTPDGRRLTFRSDRGAGIFNLYWQLADGSGSAQRLTESPNAQWTGSWYPSGKLLMFEELNPQTGYELMSLPLEGDEASGWKAGKPTSLNIRADQSWPMLSPDGRWIAYQSSESGRPEIYVRPFPGAKGKWQISTDGGSFPIWSHTRRELFFATPDNHLMVVSYGVDADSFRADKPRLWSDKRFDPRRGFDLHPDGDRIALAVAPEQAETKRDKVVFIFNFFDELRRIAPIPKR